MKIAAFDPGIALTGYAIVDGSNAIDYGVISTPANTPPGDRCLSIYRDVIDLLEAHKPVHVAYEVPFLQVSSRGNNTNAGLVQYATGALLMAFAICRYPMPLTMIPGQIKKHATGNGRADKVQVRESVLNYYGIAHAKGTKDDAYDALAGAIAAQALITQAA